MQAILTREKSLEARWVRVLKIDCFLLGASQLQFIYRTEVFWQLSCQVLVLDIIEIAVTNQNQPTISLA